MYRYCVYCEWGRKKTLPTITFFSIPSDPGIRRLKWMEMLAEKRPNGFRKQDSVCSIHFQGGRPSTDPQNVDYIPNLYIAEKLPDDIRKQHIISDEESKIINEKEALRRAKLRKLRLRNAIMKQSDTEPEDAWKERKRLRRARASQDLPETKTTPPPDLEPQQEPVAKKCKNVPSETDDLEEFVVEEFRDALYSQRRSITNNISSSVNYNLNGRGGGITHTDNRNNNSG